MFALLYVVYYVAVCQATSRKLVSCLAQSAAILQQILSWMQLLPRYCTRQEEFVTIFEYGAA